jgi:hypothetical protein
VGLLVFGRIDRRRLLGRRPWNPITLPTHAQLHLSSFNPSVLAPTHRAGIRIHHRPCGQLPRRDRRDRHFGSPGGSPLRCPRGCPAVAAARTTRRIRARHGRRGWPRVRPRRPSRSAHLCAHVPARPAIWKARTLRDQPCSTACLAYQRRTALSSSFSISARWWYQVNCASGACTISRSVHAEANARMYFRFRADSPPMSGNAWRRS